MAVDSSAAGLSILRRHCSNGEPGLFQWIRSGARAALTLFGVAAVAERATLGTERDLISADQQQQPSET